MFKIFKNIKIKQTSLIISKIIYFQILWLLVLYYNKIIFIPICIFSIILDYYIFKYKVKKKKYALFIFFLVINGFFLDNIFSYMKILTWESELYPLSLLQIWMIFGVYYHDFFQKFSAHKILAFCFSFLGSILAYRSGASISNLNFNLDDFQLITLFGLTWASFFVLSISIYDKFIRPYQNKET